MLQLGDIDAEKTTHYPTQSSRKTKVNEGSISSLKTVEMSRSVSGLPNGHLRPKTTSEVQKEEFKAGLRLPCFKLLGISPVANLAADAIGKCDRLPSSYTMSVSSQKQVSTGHGGTPLLTPPLDEPFTQGLPRSVQWTTASNNITSAPSGMMPTNDSSHVNPVVDRRTIDLNLHNNTAFIDQSDSPNGPWITRASRTICSLLNDASMIYQIQLISQSMPSQAKDGQTKPTFEAILETIQTGLNVDPYVTITHAVPQACIMEELPKTPPATPNARHELNDYFGNDQTIFTHAAVVPIYHKYGRAALNSAPQLPHHIAAPYSIQISVLERYIPPTMPSEINDFFSISNKSYLVDRLSELSINNGSLLLVYPTQAGGRTFTRKYINPILDPLLRQFILLNNLTTNAATMMGNMAAVDEMMDFELMKSSVDSICQTLTERPAVRGQKSKYRITHSEISEVVLDRSVWVNWYIEQEQPRLRQNLNVYHQSGGRMPESTGNQEITTGMLTREIVNGIRKSKEVVEAAGIEVGVFVITRSMS